MRNFTPNVVDTAKRLAAEIGARAIVVYLEAVGGLEGLERFDSPVDLLLVVKDHESYLEARKKTLMVVQVPPIPLMRWHSAAT
jgi:hypothetical protein